MSRLKALLEHVLDGKDLSEAQASEVMHAMTEADVEPAVKGAFLAALRVKGETAEEVRGFAVAMRDAAMRPPIDWSGPLVDTCGTGGDGSHSINISTGASLVAAACGLGVVKHGNRSISSRSGSADVLEILGIPLQPDPVKAAKLLSDTGFTFLFAPMFHPAMKEVMPVRRAMGVRTVFNMLGPLTNPARPPFQLLGAFSESAADLMAGALAEMGVERAFVVHGEPGWDEATPCGTFVRFDVRHGRVVRLVLDPEITYGIPRCAPEDLAGGDAHENAQALRDVFAGELGAHRDAIVLNAALVLEVAGAAAHPEDAVAQASKAIDSGAVTDLLKRLAAHG